MSEIKIKVCESGEQNGNEGWKFPYLPWKANLEPEIVFWVRFIFPGVL